MFLKESGGGPKVPICVRTRKGRKGEGERRCGREAGGRWAGACPLRCTIKEKNSDRTSHSGYSSQYRTLHCRTDVSTGHRVVVPMSVPDTAAVH
eukprot:3605449-Rhodomonas_salina.1